MPIHWTDEELGLMRSLFSKGKSDDEIAAKVTELGLFRSVDSVRSIRKRYGIYRETRVSVVEEPVDSDAEIFNSSAILSDGRFKQRMRQLGYEVGSTPFAGRTETSRPRRMVPLRASANVEIRQWGISA